MALRRLRHLRLPSGTGPVLPARVLTAVLQDYELSAGDQRRLRGLIADVPERAELAELDLPPEQMATAVLDVLEGVIHFADAYEENVAFIDGEE